MNKTDASLVFFLGFFVALFFISGMIALDRELEKEKIPQFDPIIASCINGHIGGLGTSSTSTNSVNGYMFDIIVPNGDCKNSVILSNDDYVRMQNNVGYFTVKNKLPVVAVPTTDYCPLEKWIWEGHLGIYNMTKYEKWMLTEYCKKPIVINLNETLDMNDVETHDIPEFGTIAMLILVIAIVSIIGVTARTRTIPRF